MLRRKVIKLKDKEYDALYNLLSKLSNHIITNELNMSTEEDDVLYELFKRLKTTK